MATSTKAAECHPDRVHVARGLCGRCYRKKRADEGYKNPRSGSRPSDCHPEKPNVSKGLCGACYRAKVRDEDPDKAKRLSRESKRRRRTGENRQRYNEWAQARRYGLTLKQRDDLFEAAGHKCEACGRTKNLHIDHDHNTGDVRGILCGGCNSALGQVGDDLSRLLALIAYLDKGEPDDNGA